MSESKKVRASKEQARGAYQALAVALHPQTKEADRETARKQIEDFLVAAERKLPTEEAYDKEAARKTEYHLKRKAAKPHKV